MEETMPAAAPAPSDRDLDVVVYGATGFVGRLTTLYLAGHAPHGLRIGLAGRSEGKLIAIRKEAAATLPAAISWPLITADAADPGSLVALAGRAHAIATTVGPYAAYGLPLVAACAQAGTHYADLTGEVLFMRDSIDGYHDVAVESGSRIVHSCGFDSIPSDLGTLLLSEAATADGTGALTDVTLVVRAMRAGVSGGTLASVKGQLDEMGANADRRALANDPYTLSPDRAAEPDLGKQPDVAGVSFDHEAGTWVGPFVMASLNTRVVRRSNALLEYAYGRRLRYREVQGFGERSTGAVIAGATMAGLAAFYAGMQWKPTRALLDRVLPAPGTGPSEKTQQRGHFRIDVIGRTERNERYVCHIAAPGDPGYAATAVMLGESVLSLALDGKRLPARAGVLTPATAMGTALVDRLRAAGHTYDVERLSAPSSSAA
jgi:short subunit dehydrogenase-like uncharacterized protein